MGESGPEKAIQASCFFTAVTHMIVHESDENVIVTSGFKRFHPSVFQSNNTTVPHETSFCDEKTFL